MRHLAATSASALTLTFLLSAGCPQPGFPEADAGTEAKTDAGRDTHADAGPDTHSDAGPDTHADAGPDCTHVDAGPFALHCEPTVPGCPAPLALRAPLLAPKVSGYSVATLGVDGGLLVAHGEPQGQLRVQRLHEFLEPQGEGFLLGAPSPSRRVFMAQLLRSATGPVVIFDRHDDLTPSPQLLVVRLDEAGVPLAGEDGGMQSVLIAPETADNLSWRAVAAADGQALLVVYALREGFEPPSEFRALLVQPDGTLMSGPTPVLQGLADAGVPHIYPGELAAIPAGGFVVSGYATSNESPRRDIVQVQRLSEALERVGPPLHIPVGDWGQPQLAWRAAQDGGEPSLALGWKERTEDGGTRMRVVRDVLATPLPTPEAWGEAPEGRLINFDLAAGPWGLSHVSVDMDWTRQTEDSLPGRLLLRADGLDGGVDITGQAEPLAVYPFHREVALTPLPGNALLATLPLLEEDGGVTVEAWRLCLP